MKTFFQDYWDLCIETGKFYKKHWVGTLVLNAVIIGGELVYFNKDGIKKTIKEKFPKKEES